MEVTVFHRLISEGTSATFATLYLLEVSHCVHPTLKGRALHQSVKTGRWGAGLEAACHTWNFKMKQLKTTYTIVKSLIHSEGIGGSEPIKY